MARTPLTAIDSFEKGGTFRRSMTFMDEKGQTEVRHFPEDSIVIICGPREIYDWYGRLVEIDEEIDHVIRKFGSRVDGKSIDSTHEIILAVKKNGKYTLAELCYKNKGRIPVLPYHKDVRTGKMSGRIPYLRCGKLEFDNLE